MWLTNIVLRLTFGITLFSAMKGHGQSFSVRLENSLSSAFFHVMCKSNGYLVAGSSYDSLENQIVQPVNILDFDFLGNLNQDNVIYSENFYLNVNKDSNCNLTNDQFVLSGLQLFQGVDTVFSSLLLINQDGDTLYTRRFFSPYFQEGVEQTNGIVTNAITSDELGESIYMVSQVVDYPPIQNNFIIRKINSEGEIVWTYINPINPNYYSCNSLVAAGNDLWCLVAGWGNNSYNKILKIDSESGILQDQIIQLSNPSNFYFAEELFVQDNGFVISCSAFDNDNNMIPALYKMDYSGNIVWQSQPQGEFAFDQQNNHLVQTIDGGFVSCGEKYDEQPSWLYPNDPAMNNTMKRIWLWKVDENGNFLWQRFYSYYDFDYSDQYFHLTNVAHDMKATPDGGVVMAGEASASCIDYPDCDAFTQQGWLLKVDECGCLVPGCDPSCVVGIDEVESESENEYFRFGPNPVNEVLNIYIPTGSIPVRELILSIYDASGKKINDLRFNHDNTTYMIDFHSLAKGNYILSLSHNGRVLQSEKLIK